MAQRNSRSSHVQSAVMQLIPRLAAFHSHYFLNAHLNDAVAYLLLNIKRDRQQTFLTIGLLAVAVGDGIRQQLPKIMELLRTTLRSKDGSVKKKPALQDDSAYICLCMLARSVLQGLHN